MALATPLYALRSFFTDKCGTPLAGGLVYSYENNTLTPKNTYTDASLQVPNTNPIILDETGKADIFLSGVYRFQVFSRDGVLIEDKSDVFNIIDLSKVAEKEAVDAQFAAQQELLNTKAPLSITTELQQQKVDKVYFDNTLSSFQNGAVKAYPTLAAANADITNIALNTKVSVLSATDGGDYYKASADATSLTKSAYDSAKIAKQETLSEIIDRTSNLFKKDLLPQIPLEKLPTVSPAMTNFFNVSNNLFNKDAVLLNTSIETDGTIVSDTVRWLSDYIPCASQEVFSITNGPYRVAYFDGNKNFITRGGITSDKLTALSNGHIRYMRLSSTVNANALMLNTGETLLPYESFDNARLQRKYASKILDSDLPAIKPEMTNFFEISSNLFNKATILPGTSIGTDGAIVSDAARWLSDYIPVEPASTFTMTDASYRIAVFDANKNFLQRSGVAATGGAGVSYAVSGNTHFVRLSSTKNIDEVMVNKGPTILPLEKYGDVKIGLEYLPEQSVVPDIDIDQIASEVQQKIGSGLNWEPSFPKLNFSIVESGTWRTPMWMNSEGTIIYGAYGGQLLQSTDEWTTRVQIGATNLPKSIAGIRTLDDGELLISTNRDEATATNSKVYKTIGYDRNNPSAATFKEVLTTGASQANINNRWGLTTYQNICTASDYGLRGENGAQNVYLSTDYGETWRLIFNLRTQVVDGRPPLTDSAHMHTVAYDPYFNRIWVCTGDNPNTATYYSDDMGETWTFVVGSTEVQYTGIIALPDAVIFGSDRAPNGVFAYHRKDRSEMPVIKPLFLINDSPTITHVFALPFKKDWLPNTPVYFAGNKTTESVNDKPVIIGFVDGKKAHLLYEHTGIDALETALGPTSQGNIISSYSTTGVAGQVIIKAKAPQWAKV